ncbi:MAG TPA: ribbon-helix-helix protein, CopG family [Candidatus Dormibacteraeota bacterium]
MRLHIEIDDEIVAEIDRRAGPRNRSGFIRQAIATELDETRRWDLLESAAGSVRERGHPWDDDPAQWVRTQRHADRRRLG